MAWLAPRFPTAHILPMSRPRTRLQQLEEPGLGAGGAVRVCAVPDCAAEGEYRAPRSRHELDQHIWLCLDHIREYNRSWDYFAGMSQADIEAHVRRDIVGWRPTWPLGSLSANTPEGARWQNDPAGAARQGAEARAERHRRQSGPRQSGPRHSGPRHSGPGWSPGQRPDDPFSRIRDDFGLFGEATRQRQRDRAEAGAGFQRRSRAQEEEIQALDAFGLSLPLSLATLKSRYKELVKQFHPDANGGDKAAEERLKLINQAYATLKNSVSLP